MKEKRKSKPEQNVGLWEEQESKPTLQKNKYDSSHETSRLMFFCYQFIYLCGITYALYKFYLFSQSRKRYLELTPTRSIFGNYQDLNDLEWKIFIPLLVECGPFGILHLFLAQTVKKYFPSLLKFLYIGFSTVMLLKVLGTVGTSLCFLIPLVMLCALFSRLKPLIWVTWSSLLIIFNCKAFQDFLDRGMEDNGEGEYKASVIIAWMLLRCVSFCLVSCEDDPCRLTPSFDLLVDILAYSFYFPNLITGPFMPYKDFKISIVKPYEAWTLRRCLWLILQIGRFCLWLWLANTSLYYFYAHSLIYNSQYIENLNSWTMAGYYCFILIFFYLKYVVLYGLPSVLARAEGFNPPEHPRCVLHVRRYYDIWKNFDVGLHKFIIDHIYIPFMGEDSNFLKQIQATVIAFTFIYVWHGAYPSVLWWCVFNFFITIVEKIIDRLLATREYIAWENKFLPRKAGNAFRLCVSGFILLLSMNSLIIFLSSVEHAQQVFRNIFMKGFPVTTLVSHGFFCCMAQGGIDLQRFKTRNKFKKN